LAQVRPIVSVEGLVVVLLDQEHATSRVVFTWEAPDQRESSDEARTSTTPPTAMGSSSMRITLSGNEGTLGAILLRGKPTAGVWPGEDRLVQQSARHLAILLENIRLQRRLDRGAFERLAFDRIGELAGSNVPVDRVYNLFARELKKLVDYQRLTISLVGRDADLLTCVYRVGQGVKLGQPEEARALNGTGFQSVVSSAKGFIVNDLLECAQPGRPELLGNSALRAAIIVPVVYGGKTIGAVLLENRLPYAYGPGDIDLLRRAATLLGPPVAGSKRNSRLTKIAGQTAAANEIARGLASSQRLEEVFRTFVSAADKLVSFDCVTLAWIDHNGWDIHAIRVSSGPGAGEGASALHGFSGIHTRLEYGRQGMGYLSLWRRQGGTFTGRDARVLDWLGFQISSALQYHCLYRHAQRQAYRLGQLHRARPPVVSSREPEAATQMTNGRAGEPALRPGEDQDGQSDIGRQGPDRSGRSLLADAAHALRSPLSSIKGYSSTLLQLDVAWSPEEYQEFLKTIDHEADELNRAIDSLLDATEEEPGTDHLNLVRVTVESLFQVVDADLTDERWQGAVWFECEPDLPPVLVDRARLAQAIGYLARCAGRTVAAGATLRVWASLEEGRPRVSIRSTRGEPAAESPHPFSKPGAAGPGDTPLSWISADLMLTVCRNLLQAHGVSLRTGPPESQEELFQFDLPVAAVAVK
jgi:GAF domain-containing protein